jgi:DNA-damage-inducible protein J
MKTETTMVRARIDTELKEESEEILSSLGLNMTDAIRIYLNQVRIHKGIPFELKIPNEETVAAFKEIDSGKAKKATSVDELFEGLDD